MNADTYYQIVSDSYADFEMAFYYQNELVGGYVGGKSSEAYGVKVGESYASFLAKQPYEDYHVEMKQTAMDFGSEYRHIDDVLVEFYADAHENYRINGIYWEKGNLDFMDTQVNHTFKDWRKSNYQDIELLFTEILNAQRYQQGMPPVQYHKSASLVSRAHSVDLIEHDLFSHTGSDGSSFYERVQRNNPKNFIDYAENLVASTTPDGGVHVLLNSFAGHRESLLDEYTVVAVGYAAKAETVDRTSLRGITTVITGSNGH